jgi:hypothetical protein
LTAIIGLLVRDAQARAKTGALTLDFRAAARVY